MYKALYIGCMKVGLSTIAERTGADVGTVSRVLRGLGRKYRIGAERCERIERAALELGYRPNFYARAQASGRFQAVGLLLYEPANAWLPPSLLSAIQRALRERDMVLHVCEVPADRPAAEEVPQVLTHAMVDGLLVMSRAVAFAPAILDAIRRAAVPALWVSADETSPGVRVANERAAGAAVEYLLGLGHRRIEMVGFRPGGDGSIRTSGYTAAMQAAGQVPYIIHAAAGQSTADAVEARLAAADRPTALLCHSVALSSHVLLAASRQRLAVPADLSLMQMGPAGGTNTASAPLTGMYLDEDARGRLAVKLLLEAIESPEAPPPSRTLELAFTEAGTCAPPPGGGA